MTSIFKSRVSYPGGLIGQTWLLYLKALSPAPEPDSGTPVRPKSVYSENDSQVILLHTPGYKSANTINQTTTKEYFGEKVSRFRI